MSVSILMSMYTCIPYKIRPSQFNDVVARVVVSAAVVVAVIVSADVVVSRVVAIIVVVVAVIVELDWEFCRPMIVWAANRH